MMGEYFMQSQEPDLRPADQNAITASSDEAGNKSATAELPALKDPAQREHWERSQRWGWHTRYD